MAIKISISLTALSLIQIGMAEVWDKKVVRLISGKSDRRITARWVGRGVVARLGGGRWFSSTKERSMKPKPSLFLAYIATSASH